MAKKSKAGETPRTETLTVRFTPKIKFAAELLARKHHRTLAGVVEWAVENAIYGSDSEFRVHTAGLNKMVFGFLGYSKDSIPKQINLVDYIWDTDEIVRLQKLATRAPDLMNFEEQRLWSLISENAYYWRLHSLREDEKILCDFNPVQDFYCWYLTRSGDMLLERVYEDLPLLVSLLKSGSKPEEALPVYVPPVKYMQANDAAVIGCFTKEIPEKLKSKFKAQILDPSIRLPNEAKEEAQEILRETFEILGDHPEKLKLINNINKYAQLFKFIKNDLC